MLVRGVLKTDSIILKQASSYVDVTLCRAIRREIISAETQVVSFLLWFNLFMLEINLGIENLSIKS